MCNKTMIKNNELSSQGEENIKNFNRMFNNLNPKHFDKFTYLMGEAVVERVRLTVELAQKLNEDNLYIVQNKLRDVQIWCREKLYCDAVEPRMEWL